ncbi:MAG TPA: pyridoxamine 5'-phosphate oxidase family protein [Dehalococcoidia bacterium]|nr:pyridoxamine 5'-phosphate oxidase family protein [Dehalococcoidia bacterium]
MPDRTQLVNLYVKAQSGDSEAASQLPDALAGDVAFKPARGFASQGRDAVIASLTNPLVSTNFRNAAWGDTVASGDALKLRGTLPVAAVSGGYELTFRFDSAGLISAIEQQSLPAAPLPPVPVKLTQEIKDAVNQSWRDAPMIVIAVEADGQARLSYRGSIQTYGDERLAFWVRNTGGGTVSALETNPKLTVHYRNPQTRLSLTFYGPGYVTKDDAERRHVYDTMCEGEQMSDPDAKGIAVVMNIERVEGIGPAGRLLMAKA